VFCAWELALQAYALPISCSDLSKILICKSTKRIRQPPVRGSRTYTQGKTSICFHNGWAETEYSCACDVPAHNYTFSWEPKLDWSAVYAGSGEIKKYFQDFAAKYELNKFIKLNHQVVGAWWDDASGKWDIKVEDLMAKTKFWTTCDIFINASGILNAWRWPSIPGIDKYKGKLLHSANWDHSVALEGNHVGLIGNG
jgi:cation diffusion facilitator CzcD-associated flavoprotein CzcO